MWPQVPRVIYQQLAEIKIPQPREVTQDEIDLQVGKIATMREVSKMTATAPVMEGTSQPDKINTLVSSKDSSNIVGLHQNFAVVEPYHNLIPTRAKKPLPKEPIQVQDLKGMSLHFLWALIDAMRDGKDEAELLHHRLAPNSVRQFNFAPWRKRVSEWEVELAEVKLYNEKAGKVRIRAAIAATGRLYGDMNTTGNIFGAESKADTAEEIEKDIAAKKHKLVTEDEEAGNAAYQTGQRALTTTRTLTDLDISGFYGHQWHPEGRKVLTPFLPLTASQTATSLAAISTVAVPSVASVSTTASSFAAHRSRLSRPRIPRCHSHRQA